MFNCGIHCSQNKFNNNWIHSNYPQRVWRWETSSYAHNNKGNNRNLYWHFDGEVKRDVTEKEVFELYLKGWNLKEFTKWMEKHRRKLRDEEHHHVVMYCLLSNTPNFHLLILITCVISVSLFKTNNLRENRDRVCLVHAVYSVACVICKTNMLGEWMKKQMSKWKKHETRVFYVLHTLYARGKESARR